MSVSSLLNQTNELCESFEICFINMFSRPTISSRLEPRSRPGWAMFIVKIASVTIPASHMSARTVSTRRQIGILGKRTEIHLRRDNRAGPSVRELGHAIYRADEEDKGGEAQCGDHESQPRVEHAAFRRGYLRADGGGCGEVAQEVDAEAGVHAESDELEDNSTYMIMRLSVK